MDQKIELPEKPRVIYLTKSAKLKPIDQQWLLQEAKQVATFSRQFLGVAQKDNAGISALNIQRMHPSYLRGEARKTEVTIPITKTPLTGNISRETIRYFLGEELTHTILENEVVGTEWNNTILNELVSKACRDYYLGLVTQETIEKMADSPLAFKQCAEFVKDAVALDSSDHSAKDYTQKIAELTSSGGALALVVYLKNRNQLYRLIDPFKIIAGSDQATRQPLSTVLRELAGIATETLNHFFSPSAIKKGQELLARDRNDHLQLKTVRKLISQVSHR